jgi:hypothetical protein
MAQGPQVKIPQLLCVACVAEYKGAVVTAAAKVGTTADAKTAEAALPGVRTADVIVNGNTLCIGHVEIQRQSPLFLANGQVPRQN